jgi:hypothetical protein
MLTGSPTYVLGVHTATLSLNLPSGVEPLELGTVWYAKLIEEVIDSSSGKQMPLCRIAQITETKPKEKICVNLRSLRKEKQIRFLPGNPRLQI